MRSLYIPKRVKDYIEELDRARISFGFLQQKPEVLEQLLSYGIALPYADSFSYLNKAVLVVGEKGIGKSPLVSALGKISSGKCNVLAYDTPTLFKQKKSASLKTYYDDINTTEYPFFVPFLFRDSVFEFSVSHIFHLKYRDSCEEIAKGDVNDAVNRMFSEMYYSSNLEPQLKSMFDKVKCYNIFKKKGYDNVNLRFMPDQEEIKSAFKKAKDLACSVLEVLENEK